VRLY
jgi:hypothetical protein